ncbi:MAG: hypothetical protein FJY80_11565, partial [Candidatus Aminicenantes bacterium]|nr:hypothetical protein [Candidatus Aminicenantes bacterium]
TADGVQVYKITAPLAKDDPELARIYEAQKAKDWVGLLNLLYVGCTRAKAELYVLGVKGGGDYPFDLLEASLPDGGGDERRPGEPVFRSDPRGPGPALREKEGAASLKAALLRRDGVFIPPPAARKSLPDDRVRRGEIAHRILSRVEAVAAEGWPSAVEAAVASLSPAEPEAELFAEVGRTIASAAAGSPLGELFVGKPGRRVLREFDFCDAEGRVLRMDRVVVDPEAVTVVDYKTGGGLDPGRAGEAGEEGRSQVRTYASILRDVFPGRKIRAILFHFDRRSLEEVE